VRLVIALHGGDPGRDYDEAEAHAVFDAAASGSFADLDRRIAALRAAEGRRQ
jgi:hypothetical protein